MIAPQAILFATLAFSTNAIAFQTYTFQSQNEHRHNPQNRKFRFYISDMYFDFQAKALKPTNPLSIAIWQDALERLQLESGVPDLEYEYWGTYPSGLSQRLTKYAGTQLSDHKIYVDLTGTGHEGAVGDHAGVSHVVMAQSDPTQIVGGIEFFNTKAFDINHPEMTLENIIHHEQLHILGLDHSPFHSARMSYGNPVWSGLSADDRQGLAHLFETGSQTEIKVTAFLDGAAAQGVEVVLIDPATGKSYQMVTRFRSGEAIGRGIPAGQYLLVGREMTPSGPCFPFPSTGFLSSFYVDDDTSTNQPSVAELVEVPIGKTVELKLQLIKGTKRFDCYWAMSTYTSERVSDLQLPMSDREITWSSGSSARRGSFRGYELYTDRDVLESKKTDTDSESGLHAFIEISPIGAGSPITITSQGYDVGLDEVWRQRRSTLGKEMNLFEAKVSSDAASGSYSGICEADGEFAIVSQILEIRSEVEPVATLIQKFPHLKQYMTDASLPKSIYESSDTAQSGLIEGDKPADFGVYVCGVVRGPVQNFWASALWFLLPLIARLGDVFRFRREPGGKL